MTGESSTEISEKEKKLLDKNMGWFEPLFRLPADKAKLLVVFKNLRPVLMLARPICDAISADYINKLISLIDQLTKQKDNLEIHYPRSVSDKKSIEKYYDGRGAPHYCIYWHTTEATEVRPQYQALNASLLPVFIELEKNAKSNPDTFASRAYEFCHAFRMLGLAKGPEHLLLQSLPAHAVTPKDLSLILAKGFKEYSIDAHVSGPHKTFAQIARALSWFLTKEWSLRSGSGQHSGSTRTHNGHRGHGAVSQNDDEKRISIYYPDAEFELTKYLTPTVEADLSDENNDPATYCDGPGFDYTEIQTGNLNAHFFENRKRWARRNACFTAQAIRNSNQQLLISRSSLSGHEISIFLMAIDDLNHPAWRDISQDLRQRTAAWACCRFWIGRDEDWIKTLRVGEFDGACSEITFNPATRKIFLPIIHPTRKASVESSSCIKTQQGFVLTTSPQLVGILSNLGISQGKVFARSLENNLQRLIAGLNNAHGINLTSSRLERTVPALISQLSSDRVVGNYFKGAPPNQHVPSIYTAVPQDRIQKAFDCALSRILRESGIEMVTSKENELPLDLEDAAHTFVGAQVVPKIEVAKTAVKNLRRSIADLEKDRAADIAKIHNTYTAYCALMLFMTTGIRSLTSVFPWERDIDLPSQLAFASEKDSNSYRNARLVWLHKMLIEQIYQYDEHATRLRRHLLLVHGPMLKAIDNRENSPALSSYRAPNRAADIASLKEMASRFFIIEEGSHMCLPAHGNALERYVGPEWRSKVGTLRHFVRTRLHHEKIHAVYINALLGHFESGEEPWGNFSTLSPSAWQSTINEVIDRLLCELGFSVLRSPLIGGHS